MDTKTRLLTAWSHKEPDRVPIEIVLAEPAYAFPEAGSIIAFVESEADHFRGVPAADWGFLGVQAEYSEEVIEDVPGDYFRLRRVQRTPVGEFFGITLHKHDSLTPNDFYWERHHIHTEEEMRRLAAAPRAEIPLDAEGFAMGVERVGARGLPLVGLLHPLGRLVR